MIDFLTALGLMLMLEGAIYALFPEQMKRMIVQILALPAGQIRMVGVVTAVFGFVILGVLRGF